MRRFEVISAYKDKDIHIPKRSTELSAGYDIEAAEDIVIRSLWWKIEQLNIKNQTLTLKEAKKIYDICATMVPTGLKIYVEPYEYLKIVDRSSIGVNNLLIMPHGEGIIDRDYVDNKDNEGHILIGLINLSPVDILIKKGDRIAQGIICRYRVMDNEDPIITMQERVGGFGSTNE